MDGMGFGDDALMLEGFSNYGHAGEEIEMIGW
jgi:hypothetical protein